MASGFKLIDKLGLHVINRLTPYETEDLGKDPNPDYYVDAFELEKMLEAFLKKAKTRIKNDKRTRAKRRTK